MSVIIVTLSAEGIIIKYIALKTCFCFQNVNVKCCNVNLNTVIGIGLEFPYRCIPILIVESPNAFVASGCMSALRKAIHFSFLIYFPTWSRVQLSVEPRWKWEMALMD